ncbi:hypothetical protein COX85_00935 [Candidatus Micrarchaeota archaeon CG_4_10_14_0_2_um_filter_55_9]|nr:MAG: hypothetical protein COT57_01175 [Candidatus Micrarchaeota archaeon CG09_land_8_20_14_0_10_55_25]PIZ91987.1 MAG: hypothetical protein COX85_00935 [Candidatus Micrarchaeota archaeon CG_4_10_14_0_2_um_filter_55_9]PJD01562.1 MAG: hypothetical protein COU38_00350 [Candidatus Micrarchaeota archaeon CG10_big_fil_rev_8_21_14_0_10_54_18]
MRNPYPGFRRPAEASENAYREVVRKEPKKNPVKDEINAKLIENNEAICRGLRLREPRVRDNGVTRGFRVTTDASKGGAVSIRLHPSEVEITPEELKKIKPELIKLVSKWNENREGPKAKILINKGLLTVTTTANKKIPREYKLLEAKPSQLGSAQIRNNHPLVRTAQRNFNRIVKAILAAK